MHAEIDRDIQYPCRLRKVHSQKENVTPPAVRKIHPHRSAFREDRIRVSGTGAAKKLLVDSQRMIGRVAHAEHPVVAADRAYASSHLVGQGLKSEGMIGGCQGAGDSIAWTVTVLDAKEDLNRLLEPATQKVQVSRVRHLRPSVRRQLRRHEVTVNRTRKKIARTRSYRFVLARRKASNFRAISRSSATLAPRHNPSSERLRISGPGW